METKIWENNELELAVKALKGGQLVAFPTETVYGLGAVAFNETAVNNVYLAKGRPSDNPLIVHVSNIEMVKTYAKINTKAQKLMDEFWPGPLTIVLPVKIGKLSSSVTGGLTTVASRMPDNEITLSLIDKVNSPLVGPSANISGKPSPTTSDHVYHDLKGKISGVINGGATKIGVESTVVDLSISKVTILRPGKITAGQIEAVLNEPVYSSENHVLSDKSPKAPGMKYRHYAPGKKVYIVKENEWDQAIDWAKSQINSVGLMLSDQMIKIYKLYNFDFVWSLGSSECSAAMNLFAGLRKFDDQKNIKIILVAEMPLESKNEAYNNRLSKAAGYQYFNVQEMMKL